MSFTNHNEDDFNPPPPKRIASGSSEGSRRSALSSKSTNGNEPKIEESSTTLHCSLTLPEPMQYPSIRERGYYSDIVSQDVAVQKPVSLLIYFFLLLCLYYVRTYLKYFYRSCSAEQMQSMVIIFGQLQLTNTLLQVLILLVDS